MIEESVVVFDATKLSRQEMFNRMVRGLHSQGWKRSGDRAGCYNLLGMRPWLPR